MLEKYMIDYYFDKPIKYKSLILYPIKVINYIEFFDCIDCLLFKKNRIPDANIISMPYLDFLVLLSFSEEDAMGYKLLDKLFSLLKMSLRVEEIEIGVDDNGKALLLIQGEKYTGKDFKNIQQIICEQNGVELPDETIDPKLEKVLLEAQAFHLRQNNLGKTATLEEQIICIMISTSLTKDEIENLSIRKFAKILERVDFKMHYEIYKSASMSGFVEFKKPFPHWMVSLEKTWLERFNHIMVDYDEFKGKMNGNIGGTK